MTIERELQQFFPLALGGLVLWAAYKLTSAELPALEGSINSRLSQPAASYPVGVTLPTPSSAYGGLSGSCTSSDGRYWTQLTDGNWYGKPYCAPGQVCAQNITISPTRPC